MAVVSISRIQIRRGRENQGSGLPQLASGEFGWALDTQALYIGNGSVSEGAPYVGNTKILTEHDNLFAYASDYTYRSTESYIQTGATVNTPIQRTLQARLDDIVSARSFGANGDGTNQTAALQRAIFQLFLNDANKNNPQSRVILWLEPGTYVVNSTLYLPPYTNIVGAGIEKTKITFTGTGSLFQTINSSSTPSNISSDATSTTNNQARNIRLSGISVTLTNQTAIRLQSCRDSVFEDIAITGSWASGNALNTSNVGILLNSLSSVVTCKNNQFNRIVIKNMSYGIYSDFDIIDNAWNNSNFESLGRGVSFGENTVLGNSGQLVGPSKNIISQSLFRDVDKQGILITNGITNKSSNNKFYLVGNDGGSSLNPIVPIIEFLTNNNLSDNDWFERSAELGSDPLYILNVPYIPDVAGPTIYQNNYTYRLQLGQYGTYTKFFKLPADRTKGIEVEYLYVSNQVNAKRKGTLHIVVDPTNNLQTLVDEYEYIGNSLFEENLTFQAQNYDENGDATVDTVAVMVLNSTTSDNADFYYRVKTKS